ncbi:unnamed protein product [Lactuca virosa]|uniref:Ribosomal RNA-processing protein 12-like conserved domain-containing protein n=1 Tax=Lactuca virosa TaxID=75947 RepID=A0AAU9PA63_9ASTR|nr:unnamed protein product [Lactuca virosa]
MCLFLEFVLRRVPKEFITKSEATKSMKIVVKALQATSDSTLVECLAWLLELCDLDNWESIKLGVQALIYYSSHTRLEVRKSAQICAVKVFRSFESEKVKECASELVLQMFTSHVSLPIDESDTIDPCILHMMDMMRFLIPDLPPNFASKAIRALPIGAKSSMVMRRILDFMEILLEYFEDESELTPIDTVIITKKWISEYSLIICRIAGLLTSDHATATRASSILKEKLGRVFIFEDQNIVAPKETKMVVNICDALLEVLSTHANEHSLPVIAGLFQNIGNKSIVYMHKILLKLAEFMTKASGDVKRHVQECIGCAVIVMKPEKVHEFFPISVDPDELTYTNTWLIPIYRDHVVLSSLGFFIRTIVPLSESFMEACKKVEENSEIRKQFESHARDHMIKWLKKDVFMIEHIGIALQYLVKGNKGLPFLSGEELFKDWGIEYGKKVEMENMKAMLPWLEEFLKAFIQVFFQFSPEKPPAFVKDTIRCLTLAIKSSKVKVIFRSSLKNVSVDEGRPLNLILELASLFVEATGVDSDDIIYNSIEECLKEGVEDGDAYAALYKILVESSDFRSSKFKQVIDLLLGLKPPKDITSLRWRFLCFKILLVHSMEIFHAGKNIYGIHMLYEIIVRPRDKKSKKVAGEILVETSTILKKEPSPSKPGNYQVFISMIMLLLFWSPYHGKAPSHVKADAVSALSLLVSDDPQICLLMPDVVPSILGLLDKEDNIQVVKGVLWFIENIVVNLPVRKLHDLHAAIFRGLYPWSDASLHDIKSKVDAILMIIKHKISIFMHPLSPEEEEEEEYMISNQRWMPF